ncbi:very short patch repair endonuclease [Streptomyces chrestomyceticus]|uniref:Very short patch repair endonuclease n=1 Tax=Streptomyces chrestomyceticus TaxID=68185 RepID=A0ABU7X3B2_9ACTN
MKRQARRDTDPEMAVRRLLYRSGIRYRLQRRVPGMQRRTIDIAFPGARVAVFIDGCFWHGCPRHATHPKANAEWWRQKLDRNMSRDQETTEHLTEAGWTVLRFWEHEEPAAVTERITEAVSNARARRRQGSSGMA